MKLTRRRALQNGLVGGALAGGAVSATQISDAGEPANPQVSSRKQLRFAGYPYERVRALIDGRVELPGYDVKFENQKIGELNRQIFGGNAPWDVAEVGLIPFLLAFANGGFRGFQLLPVFVLKVFRHKSIFVHVDGDVRTPSDLKGRKVATVGYSSSGLTWVRGILEDEYGVKPSDIEWIQTSKDSASGQTGGASQWEKKMPDNLNIQMAPEGIDESELLLSGEVDAVFHPAEPRAFVERHPKVRRLFDDCRKVEQAYFRKTGIFPIMHVVAIKTEVAEHSPELPKLVFDAYAQAKQIDYWECKRIRWAYSSLPWFGQEFDETVAVMGDDFYSYGLADNRQAMATACRYLFRHGLSVRQLEVDELFVPGASKLTEQI